MDIFLSCYVVVCTINMCDISLQTYLSQCLSNSLNENVPKKHSRSQLGTVTGYKALKSACKRLPKIAHTCNINIQCLKLILY